MLKMLNLARGLADWSEACRPKPVKLGMLDWRREMQIFQTYGSMDPRFQSDYDFTIGITSSLHLEPT